MSNTVNLAERFANSEKFKTLFQDGMSLVEESANYLDGLGRDHAKKRAIKAKPTVAHLPHPLKTDDILTNLVVN